MIVHAHIGARDLFPTLLAQTIQNFGQGILEPGSVLYPNQKLKSVFSQEHVVTKLVDDGLSRHVDRAIISAHGLLGKTTEKNSLYPQADIKLRSLAAFLSDCRVCIHLIVTPQYDYKHILEASAEASWVNIVLKIKKHFPHSPIVVWPFEAPHKETSKFVEELIGRQLNQAQREEINRLSKKQRFSARKSESDAFSDSFATYLDELYEYDLAKLQQMSNVKVHIQDA